MPTSPKIKKVKAWAIISGSLNITTDPMYLKKSEALEHFSQFFQPCDYKIIKLEITYQLPHHHAKK